MREGETKDSRSLAVGFRHRKNGKFSGLIRRIFLAHYDVPYLHMKELAHFFKPFDKWKDKEGTRRSFMRDAARIINSVALHGFIAYSGHGDFKTVNGIFQLEETFWRTTWTRRTFLHGANRRLAQEKWIRYFRSPLCHLKTVEGKAKYSTQCGVSHRTFLTRILNPAQTWNLALIGRKEKKA